MKQIKDYFVFHQWPSEALIGLEVEIEGEKVRGIHIPGWVRDNDGSLRGYGIEFVLEEPLSEREAYREIDELYRHLKEFGRIKPSDRCGVHIHVNCQRMEIEQVFNYITLYLILEDLILRWCGEDREGNLFCLRAKDAEWLIYSLIGDKENYGIFHEMTNKGMYKYAAINVAAIRYYGSLEFRSLRTPSSSAPIKDFISLLLRIRDKSLEVKEGRDFISACSARGEVEWAREILGPHFNMLRCEGMDRIIMEGVRRTQALAYAPLKKIKDLSPKIKKTKTWAEMAGNEEPQEEAPAPRRRRIPLAVAEAHRIEDIRVQWRNLHPMPNIRNDEGDEE